MAVPAEVESEYVGMFFRLRRILGSLSRGKLPNASLSGGAIARRRPRGQASDLASPRA